MKSERSRILPAGIVVLAACAACGAAGAAGSAAIATVPGEWWETTVQMSMAGMEGMHMPPNTSKICRPKAAAWTDPPPMEKGDCKVSGQSVTGNHMTWKMTCTQPQASGSGEMTFTGSDYTGSMTMTMPQGTMNMNLSGRRLGGDCDANAPRKEAANAQQQAADMKAQACLEAARNLDLETLNNALMGCTDPANKAEYCKTLATLAGYRKLAGDLRKNCSDSGPSEDLSKAAAYCGASLDTLRTGFCANLKASESDLEFLGACCPAESRELAQRECAGRKYTDLLGSKYQSFCTAYAADVLASKPPATAPAEGDTPVKKGKKIFKGLFGK